MNITRDHEFVPHPDPHFGSAFGGGCGARVPAMGALGMMILCGYPRDAHPPTTMRLFLVSATDSDYDTFSHGVVWARDAADAIEVVHETIAGHEAASVGESLSGIGPWWRLARGARLVATEVARTRGPVLGHGTAG